MNEDKNKIKVRINNFNEKHFRSIGYNEKLNDYIVISENELPSGSGLKVERECFYCKNMFKVAYRRSTPKDGKLCCSKCKQIKSEESTMRKYGVKCSLRNPNVLRKSILKNQENYGVDYPFQSKFILEKCAKTSQSRYPKGYRRNSISKQQRWIHKIYGGTINHSVFPYFLDIFFPDDCIYFEYDGSGHKLSIKLGIRTEIGFAEKERERRLFLQNMGYKEFRIISEKDNLPNQAELLEIKDKAFRYLKNGFLSYIYDVDTKTESFLT